MLLTISISILVIGVIILIIVFPLLRKSSASAGEHTAHTSVHADAFYEGLTHIDIQNPQIHELLKALHKDIVGMDSFLHGLLLALLAHGHVLVEGAPGLAKTKTLRLLASLLDLNTKRIQFTPDMLPADIIGVEMFNQSSQSFDTLFGPLFTHILLADEINRATPKVQSALLEAMEERQVTINGVSHILPDPFFVLATQNPLEHEGTYILPEAQLDRFMMKLSVGYPSEQAESAILERASDSASHHTAIFSSDDILRLQKEVAGIHADTSLNNYIASLVVATRKETDLVTHGSSPRGSLAVLSLAKALAFLEGRKSIDKNDVRRVLLPALRHRIALGVEAQMDGKTDSDVLYSLISASL